jgi:NhaP-type Na+/H+ or K+/H+ antiporter
MTASAAHEQRGTSHRAYDTMSIADLAIVAALIFGWGTLSARLERFDVTAPVTFVLAGLLLTHGPLAVLDIAPSKELIKELAEFTLALVLFSDASRVGLHELRVDAGLYVRLLGVALPLTIGLGTLLALALAGGSIWLALLVGAGLAPTDAALGAGMMANPAVPARIRRLVNVESGLNDGIATPFVSVALAGAATAGQIAGHGPAAAVAELAVGIVVGVAAGGAGGLLVNAARRRGWAADGFAGAAVLGLVAWFGPRGLASVVFALLALEELSSPTADRAVAVIAITVLLSVIAHGATAEPLAARYAKLLAHRAAEGPGALMPDMPDRRLIRRSPAPRG